MKSLNIFYKILILNLIGLNFSLAQQPSKAQCKDVFGIQEMQDFRNDGSEFISYTKTPLYSSQNDEMFFHYFAINKSTLRKLNPTLSIDILSNSKKVIKNFKFDKWGDHQHFKDLSYLKFNFQKLVRSNLSGPFDVYINLNKEERAKVSLDAVPYSAHITMRDEHGKEICSFDYAYAANYHHH